MLEITGTPTRRFQRRNDLQRSKATAGDEQRIGRGRRFTHLHAPFDQLVLSDFEHIGHCLDPEARDDDWLETMLEQNARKRAFTCSL